MHKNGWVAEWFKAHAWKVCIRQNRIGGSNPPSSANTFDATWSLRALLAAEAQHACSFARQAVYQHFSKTAVFVSKEPFFSAGSLHASASTELFKSIISMRYRSAM